MKISKLFSLAALALITTACSDQIEQVQQPRNTEGIPFTATISTEGHAATRLLAESGTSITATWATGEKVALIYTVGTTTYLEEATVTPQTDGTATISTTLDGSPTDDTDVTIVYPASAVDGTTKDVKPGLLTSQNGLLTGTGSISDKYDLRKTSTPAKLKIDGTTASLKGTVKLAQQVSILKLTLQSGGSSLSAKALAIKDASDNLLASATLATAGSVFYMAVPAMEWATTGQCRLCGTGLFTSHRWRSQNHHTAYRWKPRIRLPSVARQVARFLPSRWSHGSIYSCGAARRACRGHFGH